MWVRKFPSELKNDKSQARIRRKNPTIPVIIALVVSLVELLYDPTLSFFLITFASMKVKGDVGSKTTYGSVNMSDMVQHKMFLFA